MKLLIWSVNFEKHTNLRKHRCQLFCDVLGISGVNDTASGYRVAWSHNNKHVRLSGTRLDNGRTISIAICLNGSSRTHKYVSLERVSSLFLSQMTR